MKWIGLIGLVLISFSIGATLAFSIADKRPKEIIVEIPESLVVTVAQKYNLTNTEYVKRV